MRSLSLCWVVGVLCAASALASENPPQTSESGLVALLVFDTSGHRLAGASVRAGQAIATTNAAGLAELTLPPGPHVLLLQPRSDVDATGEPQTNQIPITVQSNGVLDVIVTLDLHGRAVAVDLPEADPADITTPTTPRASPTRVILLHVTDALTGAPIGETRCFLRGGGLLGTTDDTGDARVPLPLGESTVSFVHAHYSARIITLSLAEDATRLDVELLPAASDLDELLVRAPHIDGSLSSAVQERREQKQVVEVIGQEQMKRAGDGDAAAALRRATGLTVVGGRYVYVRGLGERYSATLLDGASLPSPEPERRVIPLDMFPSRVLSSVMVQKTWSPELPGEFGGGAVLLRTRRLPERRFLEISLSGGGLMGSTFSNVPMGPSGALDALGIDDGTRALPSELRAASADQPLAEKNALSPGGYDPRQLERFGESLPRALSPSLKILPPSGGLSATLGQPISLPFGDGGVLGAASWSQDWQSNRIERQSFTVGSGGRLEPLEQGVVEATDRSMTIGALVGLGLDFSGPLSGHSIQSTTFLNRISDDEVRVREGFDRDVDTDVRATRMRWVERTLLSERLAGEHPLPLLESVLSWRYDGALALRDEPDLRELRYERDPTSGVYLLSDRPDGNQRLFSSLFDQGHDAEVSWRLPLPSFTAEPTMLTTGLAGSWKAREVDTRRYKFVFQGPTVSDAAVRSATPEEIFSPQHIGPDGLQLAEATRKTDNYSGAVGVGALYTKADVPLPFDLSLSGGVRIEAMHMGVTTFELFNAAAIPTVASLDTLDLLPALALTWSFLDDMQLRFGAASTVSRPEMRELSPAVFTDVTGGRSRYGNPELKPASIKHLDARWEWYLSTTDSISVAVFGKHFTSPIETVITSGSDQAITWANADSALNVGAELEFRVGLQVLHPMLEDFALGGNSALIWSQVTLPEDGIQTSRQRALEGQSPWVANIQLTWNRETWGSNASVLYNVAGPRISEVGVLGAPDVYELPLHRVDLVWSQALPWGLGLSLRGQNLLGSSTVKEQGGKLLERVEQGPQLSASISMKL